MAGLRRLDGIHRQRAQRVGQSVTSVISTFARSFIGQPAAVCDP